MPTSEKRQVQRSSNVLMVNYRQVNKSREYLLGIANNYSHKGISFEAACIESKPGEELELILKNPYSELSISAIGEMVWKTDGWYKCITGLKLKHLDQDAVDKIKGLVTNSAMLHDGPPLNNDAAELSKEGKECEEKDSTVVDGVSDAIAKKAEIVPPGDNTTSISDKKVASQVEKKTEIHPFQNRTDSAIVKIIIIALLLVVSALFVFKTVKIKAGTDEDNKQTMLSGAAALNGRLTQNNGNTGPRSPQDADTPVINTEMNSDDTNQPEKPEKSLNSSALRQPPGQRGEIVFDLDSDVVSPAFRPIIDTVAATLLKDTGAILKVEGYSDSKGPELYNLDLAMRRSLQVKKLLMEKGVHERRIKVAVYGESYSVSSNSDEVENAADRRVNMVIIPSPRVLAAQ